MSRHSVAKAAIRRPAPCDTAQERFYTHGRRATWRATGACVVIQSLYRDRGRRQRSYDTAVCHDTMRDTTREACDTARGSREAGARSIIRPVRPTTRPATSHNMAGPKTTTRLRHGRSGRSARSLFAQAGLGCEPGAPNPVLT